jgi:hypothetical protein
MQGQYGYPLFAPLAVPDHDVMRGNVKSFTRQRMHSISRRRELYNKFAINHEIPDKLFNTALASP